MFDTKALRLYFIAGTQDIQKGTLPAVLEAALAAGITMYQFREKGTGSLSQPAEILAMARRCQELCRSWQVPFIVNDNLELAIALQADGIHIGQDDVAVEQVLASPMRQQIIGLSCYNEAEVLTANRLAGVDYVGLGPVFGTVSKDDAKAPFGVSQLTLLTQLSQKPNVAIGGINQENVQVVRQSQTDGVSVISAITRAADIKTAIRALA